MSGNSSKRSRLSPGSVQGRGNNAGSVNKAYAQPVDARVRLDIRSIACTSCGAGAGEPCINKGEGRNPEKKGQPLGGDGKGGVVHPERKRMAIRLRNQRLEAGTEQMVQPKTSDRIRPHRLPFTSGEGTCPVCDHTVPLYRSEFNLAERGIHHGDLVLRRHLANGGRALATEAACLGSNGTPVR